MNLRIFSDINWSEFISDFKSQLKNEIKTTDTKYILAVDEKKYKQYLFDKYKFEEISILKETENIIELDRVVKSIKDYDIFIDTEFFQFKIQYNYSGSPLLFKICPNPFTSRTFDVEIDKANSTISFTVVIKERDPSLFNQLKEKRFNETFTNLENVNRNAEEGNKNLKALIESEFDRIKSSYLKDNEFFEAINVKSNKSTETIFSVPSIKKRIIPELPSKLDKELSSVPTMSHEMYDDILKIIFEAGKNMEKKPSLYLNKDEEGLRDQFLFILETRYEGTTATGETFNKSGKTDLLMKYSKDNSNLFIAECKFWHGPVEFHKAISQLFEKYLTWRDSKVALIFFVTNKDFTNVLKSIKEESMKNKYFVKYNGERGESSFSYIFSLPQDVNKQIYLEILAFHYVEIQ